MAREDSRNVNEKRKIEDNETLKKYNTKKLLKKRCCCWHNMHAMGNGIVQRAANSEQYKQIIMCYRKAPGRNWQIVGSTRFYNLSFFASFFRF